MTTKVEKKFPRREVIERQHEECARTLNEVAEEKLDGVTGGFRGGSPDYGLPPPPDEDTTIKSR